MQTADFGFWACQPEIWKFSKCLTIRQFGMGCSIPPGPSHLTDIGAIFPKPQFWCVCQSDVEIGGRFPAFRQRKRLFKDSNAAHLFFIATFGCLCGCKARSMSDQLPQKQPIRIKKLNSQIWWCMEVVEGDLETERAAQIILMRQGLKCSAPFLHCNLRLFVWLQGKINVRSIAQTYPP